MEAEEPVNLDGPIVDTNVVVRFFRKEDAQHAVARQMVEEAEASGRRLVLMDVVVAETVYVMESVYKCGRTEIAEALAGILDHPGIGTARPGIILQALAMYGTGRLHFVDCYLMAVGRAAGRKVLTFDKGMEK